MYSSRISFPVIQYFLFSLELTIISIFSFFFNLLFFLCIYFSVEIICSLLKSHFKTFKLESIKYSLDFIFLDKYLLTLVTCSFMNLWPSLSGLAVFLGLLSYYYKDFLYLFSMWNLLFLFPFSFLFYCFSFIDHILY